MIMNSVKNERIAICCILLDVMSDVKEVLSLADSRHYPALQDKTGLTDEDFKEARSCSVLSALVVLKSMHYNKKMLLALTVCDIYSECEAITLNHRIAFEVLMNAIEWPISFSEILTISRSE